MVKVFELSFFVEKFSKKFPYLRTSPQIFCDGENIGGFTDLIEEDPNDLR